MTTAVLQCVIGVLKLCFGAAGLRVSRLTRGEEVRSTAWLLVGLSCAVAGVNSVLHSGWALWALLEGPEAEVYRSYLAWAPAVNYSRHAIMLLMALGLLGLPLLHRLPRASLVRGATAALLTGMAAAAWVGSGEGAPEWAEHYITMAALDGAEMILVFTALLAALVLGTMDRLLWAALTVYATRQAVNVLSYSAIAWIQVPGAWSLSPRYIASTGAVLWAVLLALALRRLALAGRGQPSPALLEPFAGRAHSTLG
jgi:hypothetical protein